MQSKSESSPYLIFNLQDQHFAFPCSFVKEIINRKEWAVSDSLSSPILGLLPYHTHQSLPVLDLCSYLGFPNNKTNEEAIGIILVGKRLIAILFPEIAAIEPISSKNSVKLIDPELFVNEPWFLSLPAGKPEETQESKEFVSFTVVQMNGCKIAIQSEEIKEIYHLGEYTLFPVRGKELIGFKNVGGVIIPLFDFSQLLGRAPLKMHSLSKIILTKIRSNNYGCVVDEVLDVVSCAEDQIQKEAKKICRSSAEEIEWVSLAACLEKY